MRRALLFGVALGWAVAFAAARAGDLSEGESRVIAGEKRGSLPDRSGRKEYVLGIQPYATPQKTATQFTPLAKSLGVALDAQVRLRTSTTAERFAERLASGAYDFAFITRFDLVRFAEEDYLPLVRFEGELRLVAFVLEESALRSLADLRGQIVTMPARRSDASLLSQLALERAGFDLETDVEIRYARNHASCLHELLARRSHVCFSFPIAIDALLDGVDVSVRAIPAGLSVARHPWVAHRRVPETVRKAFQAHLLGLGDTEEGRAVLRESRLPGFVVATSADYQMARDYWRKREAR